MLIAAERSQYEPRALPRAPMQPLQQEPQVARQEEWPQATELELPADSPLPLSVTTNTENDWEIIEDSFNEKAKETLQLVLLCAPVLFLYGLVFSELGYGATVFKFLSDANYWAQIAGGIGTGIVGVLYVLDFNHWEHIALRIFRALCLVIVAGCASIAVILQFRTRPYAPILYYIVVDSIYCLIIYWAFFSHRKAINFIQSLSLAQILLAVITVALWIGWAAVNFYWWGTDSKREMRERLRVCEDMSLGEGKWCQRYGQWGTRCPAGCTEVVLKSACDPTQENCLAAFMLWASLWIVGLFTLVLASAAHAFASAANAGEGKLEVSPIARTFLKMAIFLVFCMWVSASIAGASMALSNVITAFAMVALGLLVCVLYATLGAENLTTQIKGTPVLGSMMEMRNSDWLKALLVLSACIFFPAFLAASFVNQFVRKMGLGKTLDESDQNLHLTLFGSKLWTKIANWDWTSILAKGVILGLIYFLMEAVVKRFTMLFLAWLNIQLAPMNIWVISIIVFGVAQVLFAIPVVPGVPAYMACGVIIGAAGETQFGSFALAMLWGCFVALASKLAACIIQMKIFGGLLGSYTSVRATVGVNSSVVKAIRFILSRKGNFKSKVYILVGGPDWPTSVLTGILGQPLVPMLLGTLPVLIPIAFTVMTGGGMLKSASGDDIWVGLSGLFTTLAAVSLGGCSVGFMLAVDEALTQNKAEIEAIPDDEAVKEYDEKAAIVADKYKEASRWTDLPWFIKAYLVVAFVLIYCATMLFGIDSPDCFEDADLTTDYRLPPINSNFANLIKYPLGWVGVFLEIFGVALYIIFKKVISCRTSPGPVPAPLETTQVTA